MLIQCDASQLEWRVAVEYSKDPIGIKEIVDQLDIHSNNEKELQLPSRLIAKIFLFRTIFRGSGWSFANDPAFQHVSADPNYWDERNKRFYIKYKELDNLHIKWAQTVAAKAPIRGISGREWFVPMKIDKNGLPKMPWTDLTNWPVQGTGADIMAVARISLRNRLKKYKMEKIKLISTVHDSIVADSPDDQVQATANLMYEVFDDLPKNFKKLFNYEMVIPFPCGVKAGTNLLDNKLIERTN